MRWSDFFLKYLEPYKGVDYIYDQDRGYIVWRRGTGENTELLHIRAFKYGCGFATELLEEMLERLEKNPPFYSVFGFMLSSNAPIRRFYEKHGFHYQEIVGPYKGGNAVMVWQDYEVLYKNLIKGGLKEDDQNKNCSLCGGTHR